MFSFKNTERCFRLHDSFLLYSLQKFFPRNFQVSENLFDDEFRNRIDMRLNNDRSEEIFPRPFFMPTDNTAGMKSFLFEKFSQIPSEPAQFFVQRSFFQSICHEFFHDEVEGFPRFFFRFPISGKIECRSIIDMYSAVLKFKNGQFHSYPFVFMLKIALCSVLL